VDVLKSRPEGGIVIGARQDKVSVVLGDTGGESQLSLLDCHGVQYLRNNETDPSVNMKGCACFFIICHNDIFMHSRRSLITHGMFCFGSTTL
jgi:hypothetical protein